MQNEKPTLYPQYPQLSGGNKGLKVLLEALMLHPNFQTTPFGMTNRGAPGKQHPHHPTKASHEESKVRRKMAAKSRAINRRKG